jgi:hypothetical protein
MPASSGRAIALEDSSPVVKIETQEHGGLFSDRALTWSRQASKVPELKNRYHKRNLPPGSHVRACLHA